MVLMGACEEWAGTCELSEEMIRILGASTSVAAVKFKQWRK